MELVITIRKEIEDQEQGETIYRALLIKLEDYADLKVTGHVSNHFSLEEEPS